MRRTLTRASQLTLWRPETALSVLPCPQTAQRTLIDEPLLRDRDTPRRSALASAVEMATTLATSPPRDHTDTVLTDARPPASLSFVEYFMAHHPRAFFYDVVMGWTAFLADGNHKSADEVLSCVPLRERQLLNGKVYDPCFSMTDNTWSCCTSGARSSAFVDNLDHSTARSASRGHHRLSASTHATRPPEDDGCVASSYDDVDTHAAAAALVGTPQMPNGQSCSEALSQPGGLFYAYSLVHFAAELGSMSLIDFALSRLPNGVPFVPLYTDAAVHHGTPILLQSHPRRDLSPSVDWIACHGIDFSGSYPSHLASINGATNVLEWLTDRYGATFVLQQQQTVRTLRSGGGRRVPKAPAERPTRTNQGLTAIGCALAFGQLTTLEWLHAKHPDLLREATQPPRLVAPLLSAAVRPGGACARSLQFLLAHRLLHDDLISLSAAPYTATPTAITAALHNSGCRAVVFAAAEAGNGAAMEWFLRCCGDQLLLVTDRVGATVVHHCARGGQQHLLRALLRPPTSGSVPSPLHCVEQSDKHPPAAPSSGTTSVTEDVLSADVVAALWAVLPPAERLALVDALDDRSRTPAVWCVLGTARPLSKIETLTTLITLGSVWPQYQNEQGQTLLDFARLKYSHFSSLCRFIRSRLR